jgi:hypothetical protein
MGDRTHVTLEVPQAHKDKAIEILGGEPQDVYQDGAIFEARWEDVNYGGINEHVQLVKYRIPHILTWLSGGNYGPGSLVYDGQDIYEVNLLFDEPCAVVAVAPDGTINPTNLAIVINYYQVAQKFRQSSD